jgi:hypothetical protein
MIEMSVPLDLKDGDFIFSPNHVRITAYAREASLHKCMVDRMG